MVSGAPGARPRRSTCSSSAVPASNSLRPGPPPESAWRGLESRTSTEPTTCETSRTRPEMIVVAPAPIRAATIRNTVAPLRCAARAEAATDWSADAVKASSGTPISPASGQCRRVSVASSSQPAAEHEAHAKAGGQRRAQSARRRLRRIDNPQRQIGSAGCGGCLLELIEQAGIDGLAGAQLALAHVPCAENRPQRGLLLRLQREMSAQVLDLQFRRGKGAVAGLTGLVAQRGEARIQAFELLLRLLQRGGLGAINGAQPADLGGGGGAVHEEIGGRIPSVRSGRRSGMDGVALLQCGNLRGAFRAGQLLPTLAGQAGLLGGIGKAMAAGKFGERGLRLHDLAAC